MSRLPILLTGFMPLRSMDLVPTTAAFEGETVMDPMAKAGGLR